MKIPIVLSELILKVYKNTDESILNTIEKALLVNTSFNNSVLIYVNGQNDQSLKYLESTKQRIISYYDEVKPSRINNNNYNNLYNNISTNNLGIINNSNSINLSKNSMKRSLFYPKFGKHNILGTDNFNNSFATPEKIFDKIDRIMSISNRKSSLLRMDNINSLFLIEFQKNRSTDKKYSIIEKNFENFKKFKSEYEVNTDYDNMFNERNSGVNVKPLFDIKNYDIPKYMKNPLLMKIVLLMCEIEIDKKNFYAAYEHIKTSIIIMYIMKNLGENKLYEHFQEEIRIMLAYLNQIEQLNDIKLKKKEKLNLKKKNKNKSNRSIMHSNNKLNYENNNNSLNNTYLNNTLNYSNYSNYKKSNKNLHFNNDDTNNGFLAEEIEKFFIFLSSLSIYQIKILNDFQPKTKNKNDLPILFHSQFKDSLSGSQRISLEKLQTMTLSRYMILQDPDKPILPTNLKFEILNKKKQKKKKNINNFSFNYNVNFTKTSNEEDDVYSMTDNDSDIDISIKTKEHEIFQKIMLSKNNNIELRKFLFKYYDFVIKILRNANEADIENIIENPKIIVEPIKTYIKNNKNAKSKIISMSMNRQCFKINEFNYLFRNSSAHQEIRNRLSKNHERKRMKSSFYSIDDFCFGNKKVNTTESRKLSFSQGTYI